MRRALAALAMLAAAGCSEASEPAPRESTPAASSPTPSPTPSLSRREATDLLWHGVRTDDADEVGRAIAAGADLEVRRAHRRTPLIEATRNNRVEIARQLLEAGADPNAKDDLQDSAFLYAGAEGLDSILKLTIMHGADVRSTNRFGGTALIPASEHAHVDAVVTLLDAGVPVDHVNDLGWTALHEAIVLGNGSRRHVQTVRLLLEAGADPTIPDRDGVLPLRLAQQRGYTEIAALLSER